MKKIMAALGAAALFGLALGSAASATPSTAPSAPALSFKACPNLDGKWYVNPDEEGRRPIVTAAGLKFEGNDLVHHGATGPVEGLNPGSFAASPAPDQPSFFSVEVRNGDGSGYATLRWNTTTSKWNMVVAGTFYENANAADLVKMTTPPRSSSLLSFGVGYTNSPPGTVDTTVSSVTFKGVKYDLTCKPAPSQSASGSASAQTSASRSVAPVPVAQEGLPVTGAPVPLILGSAAALLVVGVGAVWLSRRGRTVVR